MDERERRLVRILRAHLDGLARVRQAGLEAFLVDETLILATERRLQVALQAAIDLASHRVVQGGLPAPERYAQAFRLLAMHQGLDLDLAGQLSLAVGLRNLLVHDYADVDAERLFRSLDYIGDLARLGEWIVSRKSVV